MYNWKSNTKQIKQVSGKWKQSVLTLNMLSSSCISPWNDNFTTNFAAACIKKLVFRYRKIDRWKLTSVFPYARARTHTHTHTHTHTKTKIWRFPWQPQLSVLWLSFNHMLIWSLHASFTIEHQFSDNYFSDERLLYEPKSWKKIIALVYLISWLDSPTTQNIWNIKPEK